jgi:hypothetical protein
MKVLYTEIQDEQIIITIDLNGRNRDLFVPMDIVKDCARRKGWLTFTDDIVQGGIEKQIETSVSLKYYLKCYFDDKDALVLTKFYLENISKLITV